MDAGSEPFDAHGDTGEWEAGGSQPYGLSDEDDLDPGLDSDEE